MPRPISVILLNWKRPENIKYKILPTLKQCPEVQEIIVSHANPDTIFETEDVSWIQSTRIIHYNDIQQNKNYGVALRFIRAAEASLPLVLVLDDDIVPEPITIRNMIQVFLDRGPCLVSLSGRGIQPGVRYSPIPPQFPETFSPNGYSLWSLPISLTQCCLLTRNLAQQFVHKMELFEPVTREFLTPTWNGEDIVMSLLSIDVFKKPPIICRSNTCFPFYKCQESEDLSVAIHKQPGHVQHRTRLLRYALCHLFTGIPHNLIHGFASPRPVLDTTK